MRGFLSSSQPLQSEISYRKEKRLLVWERLLADRFQDVKELQLDNCVELILQYSNQLQEKDKSIKQLEKSLEDRNSKVSVDEDLENNNETINILRNELKEKEQKISQLFRQIQSSVPQFSQLYATNDISNDSTSITNEKYLSAQMVIESIRRERGVGVDASDEMKHILKSLYITLENALAKLSEDIYSSNTRFALGL